MNDPLVTRERRLALLENLAVRLNDMKTLVGVAFPVKEVRALVGVVYAEREKCQRARASRKENGTE